MSQDTYSLGQSETEARRLALQGAMLADLTEDLLRRCGLAPGMDVLDIGCGAGDVAMLAAEFVGPGGSVLGIDRSETSLALARERAAQRGLRNVSFAVGDVGTFTTERRFDAVIGRLVLLFVDEAAAALRHVGNLLRPGGIVCMQEKDFRRWSVTPPSSLWERAESWIIGVLDGSGIDPIVGAKLGPMFREAGLPVPTLIARQLVSCGPEAPYYELIALTIRSLLPAILRLKLATEAEIDIDTLQARLSAEAVTRDLTIFDHTMVGAWCRLPD